MNRRMNESNTQLLRIPLVFTNLQEKKNTSRNQYVKRTRIQQRVSAHRLLRIALVFEDLQEEENYLAFTRRCFTIKPYRGSPSSCIEPTYLQSIPYCNTIAQPLRNTRPPTDPSFECHTPYNIGDGNIV